MATNTTQQLTQQRAEAHQADLDRAAGRCYEHETVMTERQPSPEQLTYLRASVLMALDDIKEGRVYTMDEVKKTLPWL